MAIIFVKYRSRWAWGEGSWEYRTYNEGITDESLREAMEEIGQENEYSDKYRGMEWERCEPSSEVLDGFIRAAEEMVRSAERRLLELRGYEAVRKNPELGEDSPAM